MIEIKTYINDPFLFISLHFNSASCMQNLGFEEHPQIIVNSHLKSLKHVILAMFLYDFN